MKQKSKLIKILNGFGYEFVSFEPTKNIFKFARKTFENDFIFCYIKYAWLTMKKPMYLDYNTWTINFEYNHILKLDNVAISDRLKIKEALERW